MRVGQQKLAVKSRLEDEAAAGQFQPTNRVLPAHNGLRIRFYEGLVPLKGNEYEYHDAPSCLKRSDIIHEISTLAVPRCFILSRPILYVGVDIRVDRNESASQAYGNEGQER